MQPLAGTPESPASSPSALQPVVTKQGGKARKVTRHRKFKLSLGFGQKYLYMKVFGGQTNPDISTGRDAPHFTVENGNFSIKNKYISFSVYNLF